MRRELAEELAWWSIALHPDNRSDWTKDLIDPQTRHRCFPRALLCAVVSMPKPRVLDMGAGPMSCAAWGAEISEMELVAIDPLGDEYAKIIDKYGIDFPVKTQTMRGEDMAENFAPDSFDIVFTRNALDHTESPRDCLKAAATVLCNGGLFIHVGKIREGTNASWNGAHKHDLFLEGKRLMHQEQDGKTEHLTAQLPLKFVDGGCLQECPWFFIVCRKETDNE